MPAVDPHADLLAEGRDIARMLAEAARAPEMAPLSAMLDAERETLLAALRRTAAKSASETGLEHPGRSHIQDDDRAHGQNRLALIVGGLAHAGAHARAVGLDDLASTFESMQERLETIEAGR
jgi:hypothetical protein